MCVRHFFKIKWTWHSFFFSKIKNNLKFASRKFRQFNSFELNWAPNVWSLYYSMPTSMNRSHIRVSDRTRRMWRNFENRRIWHSSCSTTKTNVQQKKWLLFLFFSGMGSLFSYPFRIPLPGWYSFWLCCMWKKYNNKWMRSIRQRIASCDSCKWTFYPTQMV